MANELWQGAKRMTGSAAVFLKWIFFSGATGLFVSAVCAILRFCIEWCDGAQLRYPWLLFLLPLGGIAVAALYRAAGMENDIGFSRMLLAIRADGGVSPRVAPLIFLGTCITHLLGGSAGRIGAGLQLGGCASVCLGRRIPLSEQDRRVITMCGISAAFCVMLGTPLTAAIFAMEVVSVGVMHYSAFLPCLVASLAGYGLCAALRFSAMGWAAPVVPPLSGTTLLGVAVLAALCAGLSALFCHALRGGGVLLRRVFPNSLLRAGVGGALLAVLTLLLGTHLYGGSGAQGVALILGGGSVPGFAFLWKLALTVLTLSCGFKGGEIVPACFIGAAFGAVVGGLLGMEPRFAAAVGLIAMFCGVLNCPMASIVLSVELFGAQGLLYFALAVGASYALSGYSSLYAAQKFVYSKTHPEFIDREAGRATPAGKPGGQRPPGKPDRARK